MMIARPARASTGLPMPVVLVGTLDTKGDELAFVRDLLVAQGLATLVIDAGSVGPPGFIPDIDRDEVFRRAGTSWRGRAHAGRPGSRRGRGRPGSRRDRRRSLHLWDRRRES